MSTNSTTKQPSVQVLETKKTSPRLVEPETTRRQFCGGGTKRALQLIVVCCMLTLPALVHLARQASSSPGYLFEVAGSIEQEIQDGSFPSSHVKHDKFLGGLLTDGFDEESCLSRYQFANYHKNAGRQPSAYLVERLRKHEDLQKKCGPDTDSYKKAAELLKSGNGFNTSTDCNYLVSISYRGVGNRMLAIASAFLYAVLAERVLLIDRSIDIDDMFCEPFSNTSWLLPPDFPLKHFRDFDINTPQSYGNLLRSKVISTDSADQSADDVSRPRYVYLHLDGNYGFYDKLFFCNDDQWFLRSVPWLVMGTDSYFVPGLFLIPTYQHELERLFPEKDAVFHHLGRYLFHPTNVIWRSITRYYHSYLARAEERVGIQIRDFEKHGPFRHVLDQVLSCALKEKLLPGVGAMQEQVTSATDARSIAVLVTSLSSWYYEKIRDMYREHRTTHGDVVSVYQPSSERKQQSRNKWHNMKAMGEIYLLSMTDVLITTGYSTFGYVAQSLGGLKPWIMFKPNHFQKTPSRAEKQVVPNPPCRRDMSIEPCFHSPSYYDCKAKRDVDTGMLVSYVRHCEDVSWGVKLVNRTE